jgi:cell division septation protein DedD
MRGALDENQLVTSQPRHDTELTLSNTTLLVIFFGLVLLCGLCFGLGYALGHHGAPDASAGSPAAQAGPNTLRASDAPKPSANSQTTSPRQRSGDAGQGSADDSTQAPASPQPTAADASYPSQVTVQPGVQRQTEQSALPQVHAALPANSAQAQTGQQQFVRPALTQQGPLMVQIAAVANPEDADVLVNALRRRGYAIFARREPADNLIHVRIGPFSSQDEALRWRQKLLNDGYNAIIQP